MFKLVSIPFTLVLCSIIFVACHSNSSAPKTTGTPTPVSTMKVADTTKEKRLSNKEISLFGMAAKYQRKLMFTQAIQVYDSMLRLNPKNALALTNKASIYYILGQADSAAANADRALIIKSTDYMAHYYVGMVDLYYRNNARKAVVEFTSAITSQPNFADGYDRRGVAYSSLGDTTHAFKDFDSAIHYGPTNDMVYYNRGILYGMMHHTDKELADYKKAVSFNPNNVNALMNIGVIKEKEFKDYKGAIEDFSKIIKIDDHNAKAFYNRAKAKRGLNDNKGALQDLTSAIKIKPDYRQAYLQRSEVYRALGDKAKADKDMKTGL